MRKRVSPWSDSAAAEEAVSGGGALRAGVGGGAPHCWRRSTQTTRRWSPSGCAAAPAPKEPRPHAPQRRTGRARTHTHTHTQPREKKHGAGERERERSPLCAQRILHPGSPRPCGILAHKEGAGCWAPGGGCRAAGGRHTPPPSRTNWTRPVPRPVLTGHVPPMPRRFYLYQGGRHTWKPVLRTSWARTRCESPYVRRNRSSASAAAGARGELWAQRPTGA